MLDPDERHPLRAEMGMSAEQNNDLSTITQIKPNLFHVRGLFGVMTTGLMRKGMFGLPVVAKLLCGGPKLGDVDALSRALRWCCDNPSEHDAIASPLSCPATHRTLPYRTIGRGSGLLP